MKFPDYGVGVGLRTPHYEHFINAPPKGISWVEVISENYMDWKKQDVTRPLSLLEKVRRHLPVALHGVSLSIGSTDPLDKAYLKNLKKLADHIEPMWFSDHLCWTGVEKENLHDLLPLPYSEEALRLIVDKIKRVQDFMGRQMLIENVSSYVEFKHSEMTEWEFLSEITNRADCGILLDINNIYVSGVNHHFNPLDYLKGLPAERVGQIHLAGHTNKGSFLIDTHNNPVCDDVWTLYKWAHQHISPRSTMIEWDTEIPEWSVLHAEVEKISKARKEKGSGKSLSFQTAKTI